MQKIYTKLLLILVFFVSSFSLIAEETSMATKEYPELHITELALKNGMKVILKNTDDDSETCVRLAALGGYASVNSKDRASAELASQLVMESGIGDLCADKLSAYLYDHSIEFNLKIEPHTRSIDASLPEEGLEELFILIHDTFTAPKFSSEAFVAVLAKTHHKLLGKNTESSFDFIPSKNLSSLSVKDLDQANFAKASQFFKEAFSNPAEFVCIIAGDLNNERIKELSSQYLASIPATKTSYRLILPKYDQVPKAPVSRIQNLPQSHDSLIRLAIPLQITLDQTKQEHLELICQITETRLRNKVKKHTHDVKGVDIWYELPLYPSLDHPWMTIQFYVDNSQLQQTLDLVEEELKNIYQKGFLFEELKLALKLKKQSLQLWEHDNEYWIALLGNQYLWGWNPQRTVEKFKDPSLLDSKAINTTIHQAFTEKTLQITTQR